MQCGHVFRHSRWYNGLKDADGWVNIRGAMFDVHPRDRGREARFPSTKGRRWPFGFDTETVDPPLTDAEILDAFRADSQLTSRSREEIEAKGLIIVPVTGYAPLPPAPARRACRNTIGPWNDSGTIQKGASGTRIICHLRFQPLSRYLVISSRPFDCFRRNGRSSTVARNGRYRHLTSTSSVRNAAIASRCARSPGCVEIEDVFDAVFEWMNQAGAAELIRQRRVTLNADDI